MSDHTLDLFLDDGTPIERTYSAHSAPFNHQTMLGMGFIYDYDSDTYLLDDEASDESNEFNEDLFNSYYDDDGEEDNYYLSQEQRDVQAALAQQEEQERDSSQRTFDWWKSSSYRGSSSSKTYAPIIRKRTSETHPLQPSYIPVNNGEMGLVICPAKQGSGMVGDHERDFETDMAALVAQGVDKIYGLMPKYELVQYKAQDLLTETGTYGIEYIYCGWTDRSTPDNEDFWPCVRQALEDLNKGKRIVVHCRGGLGRTGTFAGCVLALAGWHLDSMVNALHEARGTMCPETREQTTFIRTVCAQQMAKRNDKRPIKDQEGRAMAHALIALKEEAL